MAPPSNLKPPLKNSSLQPSSRWKGKTGSLKQSRTRNANPNPNLSRRKQHTGNVGWLQEHIYQPPRLQDLQFQNRLKAFRHFDDRCSTAVYNSARTLSVNDLVASASGFGVPASRIYAADSHAGGLPQGGLDYPVQGSGFTGSLAYPGKGKATMSSFLLANHRLMVPGAIPYSRKFDPSLLSGLSLAPNSSGALNFGAVQPASHDYTGKGDASFTAGTATVVPKVSKGSLSYKRYKGSRRTRRDIIGAHKQLGAPAAPRNTTSFLMRAKKSGGIASFVSPSPVTPSVTPTPAMSPFATNAGLADEANHEWGVNDYGSMNGLIRLRSLDFGLLEYGDHIDSESEVEQGVESVQQVEQRLDHDVSRFVMTYPTGSAHDMGQNILETRMDDQDSHISHLEEENLDLKERVYSMQQEVEDLRRRMRVLEGASSGDDAEPEGLAERSPERSVANMSCA